MSVFVRHWFRSRFEADVGLWLNIRVRWLGKISSISSFSDLQWQVCMLGMFQETVMQITNDSLAYNWHSACDFKSSLFLKVLVILRFLLFTCQVREIFQIYYLYKSSYAYFRELCGSLYMWESEDHSLSNISLTRMTIHQNGITVHTSIRADFLDIHLCTCFYADPTSVF